MAKKARKVTETEDSPVDARTLARICRLDVRTILKLAEQGIVVRVARGLFAQWKSVGNVIEHYRERAAGRESRDGSVDIVKSNAALRDSQRRLTDIKIAQLEGELISLPEVRDAWAEIALAVRQLFLSLPARARFDLPHLTGEDQKALERLVHEMLTEVATEGRVRLPATAPVP
jgi:phage terminase Nu1 subunit (DNA packaging protein)